MADQRDWRNLLSITQILDHLDVGVTIFDANGKFLFVNRGSLRMSGRSLSDYENQTVFDFYDKGVFNHPVVSEVIRTQKPVVRVQRSTTKDGGFKEYLVRANPIFDGEGNIALIIADRLDMKDLIHQFESCRYSYYDDVMPSQNTQTDTPRSSAGASPCPT